MMPRLDGRGIEEGREQVVGERRVADDPFGDHELLHDGKPDTLHDPAFELTGDRLRVERSPDVLRGVDPDDADQTQLRVDVDHRAMRCDDEPGVDITLAVLVGGNVSG